MLPSGDVTGRSFGDKKTFVPLIRNPLLLVNKFVPDAPEMDDPRLWRVAL